VFPVSGNGHDQQQGNSCPFRRVLVAWDGSPDSVTALRTAAAIVAGTPGHVVALAVLPSSPPRETRDDGPGTSAAQHARDAFELARDSLGTRSVPVTLETTEGRQASKSICEFAAEHAFDLLVLGRHGQGGILHPKLGHIAQETARIARVPVLLVSAPR
jgi:nucleotide-binding universal stress UspA family protein